MGPSMLLLAYRGRVTVPWRRLSQTLIAAGDPASSRVVRIALVDGARGFTYIRMDPVMTDDSEKGVIRWT